MNPTYPPASSNDSNLNIIHYMKSNVPVSVLFIMTILNRYFFDNDTCSSGMKAGVIITFTILGIFNIIWTAWHCRIDYIHNYPESRSHWKYYAATQAIVSTIAFYSVDYYLHKGLPFNCFFQYNQVASEIMFYLSCTAIVGISYLEHTVWKKLQTPNILSFIDSTILSV